MKRRDLLKAGAAGMAGTAIAPLAARADQAPQYMPIMKGKMEEGDYRPWYNERELTEPGLLCDNKGNLNPAAVGWSRVPLLTANLKDHWPRKKKWNFWNWICPDFVYSITIAHIDYLYFCGITFHDFKTGDSFSALGTNPLARSSKVMPEKVEESIEFHGAGAAASLIHHGDYIKVDSECKAKGKKIKADFKIHKPAGHETLNIVVPWTSQRFQMNSKHNTLPTEGTVKIGDKIYEMDPANCHGVQDFGRGMWPYRTYWNWGVATGVVDGVTVGVNTGSKWTTGTGSNENGLCIGGKLYKVMEDLVWEYDNRDQMKPWKIYTSHTDMIDLTLSPFMPSAQKVSLGLIRTGGICPFGHWNGTVRAGGDTIEIRDMIGWAEEFSHRW